MRAKRFRLSPEVRSQIIAGIRAGAYSHVAAEAWGMPKDCFEYWMRRGQQPSPREPYRSFAKDVRLAAAQARLLAEKAVYDKEPKIWLIHGPGRETDACPGWSISVKPAELSLEGRNALLDPEVLHALRIVANVLADFPEARLEVARVLSENGIKITA